QWDGIRDRKDMWCLLFRILRVLASMPEQLGELSGRFAIDTSRGDEAPAQEELQVVLDAEGLHRLESSLLPRGLRESDTVPDSLVLRANATLLLPEAVHEVRVVAFDF